MVRAHEAKTESTYKHHVVHEVQHSTENRNPYEDLVAKLKGLPLVHISKTKEYKTENIELLKTGLLPVGEKKIAISLPSLFVLGAAETCAKLGGDNSSIALRTTVAAQTSIPHAPKPPSSKLKTGKSGMSSGVIPVDLSTTTMRDEKNAVCELKQNEKYRPKIDGDVVTTQFAKPLEQIILGLMQEPAEFLVNNSEEEIRATGYLEVRLNSDNVALNSVVYRVNLQTTDYVKPLDAAESLMSSVQQPSWWNEQLMGNFLEKVKAGFPVEYKTPAMTEFTAYEVYGRTDSAGNKLPITGDQDVFCIPRSSKYDLGALATEVIDTHADGGTALLTSKLIEVHEAILLQDLKNSGENDLEKLAGIITSKTTEFYQFLNSAQNYVEALGTITPYEAYFIIELNNKVAELSRELKDNPAELLNRLNEVQVTSTIGIENMPLMDIDIHPAWFKENPEHCSTRVKNQLENDRHVSPDILLLYMTYLEKTNEPAEVVGMRQAEKSNQVGFFRSSREKKEGVESENNALTQQVLSSLDAIKAQNQDAEIFLKGADGKITKFVSGAEPKDAKEILIVMHEENHKHVVHVRENQIHASQPGESGYKQIKNVLDAANVTVNDSFLPTTFKNTSLNGAIKEMHDIMSAQPEATVRLTS